MGLDMYLSAKRSFYAPSWDAKRGEKTAEAKVGDAIRKAIGVKYDSQNLNYTRVEIEVAYWRKSNQIHAWFVENCQNGVDECQESYVSREQLQELINLCKQVIRNPKDAEKIMATRSGFFFGSTNYDEWYFEDIKSTIKQLEKALKLPPEWSFTYHSSW